MKNIKPYFSSGDLGYSTNCRTHHFVLLISTIILAVTSLIGQSVVAKSNSDCRAIATRSTTAAETTDSDKTCFKSKNAAGKIVEFCPATRRVGDEIIISQQLLNQQTGRSLYCEHGGSCWHSEDFKTSGACVPGKDFAFIDEQTGRDIKLTTPEETNTFDLSDSSLKLLYGFQNDGSTVIGLQAATDRITVNEVTVNRGNCQTVMDAVMGVYGMPEGSFEGLANNFFGVGPVFQKKLPATIRFGDVWQEQYACRAIEVTVKTNRGSLTWALK